eukprot:CAMPEP_0119125682 /NCGR_PEP_ID=MMETSP1310-20130426/4875_1 /TAXON_ID=464262 /ORGANISM="Genus nov. species nov., Strain RCC2339" /LENGTH=566 /DNA_ID=CAMNT_0007115775 /DNA_START=239 /DNA_END=1936 /DNA_ORIENTATION=+
MREVDSFASDGEEDMIGNTTVWDKGMTLLNEDSDDDGILGSDRKSLLNIQDAPGAIQVDEDGIVVMDTWEFRRNIGAILTVSLIGEAARGLTVATLPLYMGFLGGESFIYTLSISLFSVGRLMGGMFFGTLSHKLPLRTCIMIAMVICALGNTLYFLAVLGNTNNTFSHIPSIMMGGPVIALVGRFVVGFGSSTVVLVRTYIAQITPSSDRTRYVGWSNASQFIGSSVLPGLGVVLLLIPSQTHVGRLQINGYNTPGLVLAVLDLVCVVVVYWFMSVIDPNEFAEKTKFNSYKSIGDESSDDTAEEDEPEELVHSPEGSASPVSHGIRILASVFFVFFNFDTRSAVSFVETAGSILYIQYFQTDCPNGSEAAATSASFFFFYLGLGGFLMYLSCEFLNRKLSSLTLLQSAFLFITIGMFLTINYGTSRFYKESELDDDMDEWSSGDPLYPVMSKWRFALGCFFIWSIGSPLSQTMLISSFSRLLGSRPQGKWQGLIAASGSLGRIVSPVVIGFLLLNCTGCEDDPPSCTYDPDSDGDYDGEIRTNYIFYVSGAMTFLSFVALSGLK